MGPDPVLLESTKAWLQTAAQDLRRINLLLDAEPPDVEDALFHSQQAAEKALKAFLTWHDVPFRKTHELTELGAQCVDLDPTLAGAVDEAAVLSQYASRFRYPGAPYEPAIEEAASAREIAKTVFGAIQSRLALPESQG